MGHSRRILAPVRVSTEAGEDHIPIGVHSVAGGHRGSSSQANIATDKNIPTTHVPVPPRVDPSIASPPVLAAVARASRPHYESDT
jgi:hypothetical protein